MQGTSFRKDLQKHRQKQLEGMTTSSVSKHSLKHVAAHDMALQTADYLPAGPQASSAAAQETVLKPAEQGLSHQAAAPQVSEGTEKVLRDLLVQPFTDQVVKLMGQGRSSKLSLSEQESAISNTVDETTVWAVSELTRLQVGRHCVDQCLLACTSCCRKVKASSMSVKDCC